MNKEIYEILETKLGITKEEVDKFLNSNDLYKAGTHYGTVSTKDVYKAGTRYGTINTKDIYKAGTYYGTISVDDI